VRGSKGRLETFRRVCGVAAAISGLHYGIETASADPTTIYKETFQYCTGSIGKDAAAETGWIGIKSGTLQGRISNLKVFSYGSAQIGGSVNSTPQGKAQGYTFWFRPVYGLAVLTAEMSFDVSLISKGPAFVEYEQRLSGVDANGVPNKTQLTFLVDQKWYISGSPVSQVKPGVWEPVKVDPSKLKYGVVPYVAGVGPEIPTSYSESLPASGKVRAFGVFLQEVNGRVRIDNFAIQTTGTIPPGLSTEIKQTAVSSCPAGSPDRSGEPQPTPTPGPDDGDGGTDQGTPPGPTPTPGPTDGGQAAFCDVKQQGAGMRVNISQRSRAAFTNSGAKKGAVALRDRAIAQLYASRLMPVGALVNARIGDYNPVLGTLRVTLKRGQASQAIRLTRFGRAALNNYMQTIAVAGSVTDPLFLSASGQALAPKKAACAGELKGIVMRRLKAARLSARGVFVR